MIAFCLVGFVPLCSCYAIPGFKSGYFALFCYVGPMCSLKRRVRRARAFPVFRRICRYPNISKSSSFRKQFVAKTNGNYKSHSRRFAL